MLGVFRMPDTEIRPEMGLPAALKKEYLKKHFISKHSDVAALEFEDGGGFLAFAADVVKSSPVHSAEFFEKDGIHCIFRGGRTHLNSGATCVNFIECYKCLKDDGNKTPDNVMDFITCHNVILYDSTVNAKGIVKAAFAVSGNDDIPLYYGHDCEGSCIITDEIVIIKKVCGDSFKSIADTGLLIPILSVPFSDASCSKTTSGVKTSAASGSGKKSSGRKNRSNRK